MTTKPMSVHYRTVEDTIWPVDMQSDTEDSTQWRLRYNDGNLSRSDHLAAASVMAAYAHLIDPNITQADAIAKLKRARKAART